MVPIRSSVAGRRLRTLAAAPIAAALLLTGCTATSAVRTTAFTATQVAAPDLGINITNLMQTALPSALNAYIQSEGGHAAVAVLDQLTGAHIEVNQDQRFQTASIVKFDILATRLYQVQKSGTTLSSGQQALAKLMITQSDNDAASNLYSADNGAIGVTSANNVFGLTETTPNTSWGRTHTTAADQIRLLSAVFGPHSPLNDDSRNYMMSLMSQVEPDQAWGITAAKTDAATGVYVKNGWVEMDDYGHMEGDNSIGRITEPGHDWLIATMSNYNKTDEAGEAILEGLAKLAVGGLRLTSVPTSD
jgi:beta-lactamase class A